jgi:mitochondrial distribution and morphology protein 12
MSHPPPNDNGGHYRERSPQDIQIVARVSYSGDVRMSLTAELLLDYPMESFIGIPLQLNITGLSFDGVAVLAYIRRRAHFCFLSPEDAEMLVGASDAGDDEQQIEGTPDSSSSGNDDQREPQKRARVGGLLEEIRVESEIGDREHGRQVLKNVGKVEKFVLEQVRRLFEDEFVYPSFWTFLV